MRIITFKLTCRFFFAEAAANDLLGMNAIISVKLSASLLIEHSQYSMQTNLQIAGVVDDCLCFRVLLYLASSIKA